MNSPAPLPARSLFSPGTASFADNFIVSDKKFTQQFSAIYFLRLNKLRSIVLSTAERQIRSLDPTVSPLICHKILDIDPDRDCLIAGTLYKEMKLKPSILDEYNETKNEGKNSNEFLSNYCSPDDSLVLEDEFGRILLNQDPDPENSAPLRQLLPVSSLFSGVVVALLGRESDIQKGKFNVFRVFTPDLAPQIPRLIKSKTPKFALVLSGLNIGAPDFNPARSPIQLLLSYIGGYFGSAVDRQFAASISRVIIAGNSLYRKPKVISSQQFSASNVAAPFIDPTAALRELDLFLTALCSTVDVDLIPGSNDPSNFTFPQQPLHKCLFPQSNSYSTFHSRTNPTFISLENSLILATAGQNLLDLKRYTTGKSAIELWADCVRCRNIAPTAPDTLPCYPFQETDPFVLIASPHIAIAGNQEEFATDFIRPIGGPVVKGSETGVRLVCVPEFSKTGMAVLIDLNSETLETETIQFDVSNLNQSV